MQDSIAAALPTWITYLFPAALLLQMFHLYTHATMAFQYFYATNDMPMMDEGALSFMHLEWTHFTLNMLYLLAIVALFIGIGGFRRIVWREHIVLASLIGFSLAFQTWHGIEHVVKISQHIQTGCEGCSGIVGLYVNEIMLHVFYSTVALVVPLYVYFRYGFFERLLNLIVSRRSSRDNLSA